MASNANTTRDDDQAALDRALKIIEKAEKPHKQRIQRYHKRYRAYRGVLEIKNDRWESQLHPPHAGNIVEILFSNLVDEHPRARVLPQSPSCITGAKALEKILAQQRRRDKFDQKIRPWIKQALIMGVSPAKVAWDYRRSTSTYATFQPALGGGFQRVEAPIARVECDQPTFLPVPVEDFWWDTAATRLDECAFVVYRTWETMASLRAMEADGVYRNVDQVQAGSSNAPTTDQYIQVDRKNRVEVIELWERDQLTTIANRQVVLRSEENPFWHRKLPFVLASTMDDLYSLEGLSEVDLVLDIQAALWEFLNQTVDNVRLLNNAIIMARDTIDDPDKLRFAPGELWLVSDPGEVQMWTPNHNVIDSALTTMEKLKEELQNLTGAVPYLSGAADGTVDQNTATGISVIQNMAARRITAKRNSIYAAYADFGGMCIQLNQQFLSKPEAILIDSENGFAFEHVMPEDIQGEYDYEIEDANESLNKQQARNEALQLFQTVVTVAPVLAQFGANPNLRPLYESLLETFDKKNTSEYFQAPVAQPFLAGGGPPAPGGPPTPGGALPPAGPRASTPQPRRPRGA